MRRRAHRLTFLQRAILDIVRKHERISYDDMAAVANADRRTVIGAVKALVYQGCIAKEQGRGRCPNRYWVCKEV